MLLRAAVMIWSGVFVFNSSSVNPDFTSQIYLTSVVYLHIQITVLSRIRFRVRHIIRVNVFPEFAPDIKPE